MSIVIRAENISKKYLIGHNNRESSPDLRETLTKLAYNAVHPFSYFAQAADQAWEEFWALKDVSFEVKQGDRIGIIGRNGAGKSTLLKILSRITEPTSGRISIKGRVASLLEVGTGFHPDLTGRENIYLNGAILGMSRAEIRRKFAEIVDFAEVEKFIDTPVKRYSSGMYVRLAFAVAAHLEPEILIVDEVLAVGDAQFQKKCLGKMEDVGREGRTVLFVSHNMNAIEQLCTCAIMLDGGMMRQYNTAVRSVISGYLFSRDETSELSEWCNKGTEYDNDYFMPLKMYVSDANGNRLTMPMTNNAEMWISIEGDVKTPDPALTVGYAIYTEEGNLLYWSYHTDVAEVYWVPLKKGRNILISRLPKRLFNEGMYRIELIASLHYRTWLCEPGCAPVMQLFIQGGLSDSPYWMVKRPGILAPVLEWKVLN